MIDTASFQRLRHLKQLGLGHTTYPNATHTRFAHSLGVLAIMSRVLRVAAEKLRLKPEIQQDLRLAALLHDVGHYPYSHLMEGVDRVILTEERVNHAAAKTIRLTDSDRYPDHEEVGRLIVTHQQDLVTAIGSRQRAKHVADLFTRSQAADPQLSKLIHSSLDMDRLDYLLRDAGAAGIPYGQIDLNYLLSNLKASPSGMIGIDQKALTAAEQFLLARYFMHKAVYYHKTTFGLEEAFRQLLRRCRDAGSYEIPKNGKAVRELVQGTRLLDFTDHFLDAIARRASRSRGRIVRSLAKAIVHRKPPKLLREERALIDDGSEEEKRHNRCSAFVTACESHLEKLARDFRIPLPLFLLAEPRPIRLEKRGSLVPATKVGEQPSEEQDELIKVFDRDEPEPRSLVDIPESLIRHCANRSLRITRLYVVEEGMKQVSQLRKAVMNW